MTNIPAIHTACKKCVFALYDNITQTGCYLDYITKYRKKNISILEVYDNEKEFYVIADKKCPSYREDSWFKDSSLSIQQKAEQIKNSNNINYLIAINLKDITVSDFYNIIDDISKLQFRPSKVIIVRHTDNLNFPFDTLKNSLDQLNIPWRIQTMIDKDALLGDILHGVSSSNPQYRFICSITNYTKDIARVINKANSIIYDDLSTFNILSDHNRNIIIYAGSVYRYSNFHGYDILNDDKAYQIV